MCQTSKMHFICNNSPYQVTIIIIIWQLRRWRLTEIKSLAQSLTTRKWQNQVHRMAPAWSINTHLPVCPALLAIERPPRITESQSFFGCSTKKGQMVSDVQHLSRAHRRSRALTWWCGEERWGLGSIGWNQTWKRSHTDCTKGAEQGPWGTGKGSDVGPDATEKFKDNGQTQSGWAERNNQMQDKRTSVG